MSVPEYMVLIGLLLVGVLALSHGPVLAGARAAVCNIGRALGSSAGCPEVTERAALDSSALPPASETLPALDSAAESEPTRRVWVRYDANEMPAPMDVAQSMTNEEVRLLLAESGPQFALETDPELIRVLSAAAGGETIPDTGRSVPEALFARGDVVLARAPLDEEKLQPKAEGDSGHRQRTTNSRGGRIPQPGGKVPGGGVWGLGLAALLAVVNDVANGLPEPVTIVETPSRDVPVYYQSLPFRGMCLEIMAGPLTPVCPTDGRFVTESGETIAELDTFGELDLDHDALHREVERLRSEELWPWVAGVLGFESTDSDPESVRSARRWFRRKAHEYGAIINPYEWTGTPEGDWIRNDGERSRRPPSSLEGHPDVQTAARKGLRSTRYYRLQVKPWKKNLVDMLNRMARQVVSAGSSSEAPQRRRAWLALTLLAEEVKRGGVHGSATEVMERALNRMRKHRLGKRDDLIGTLSRAQLLETLEAAPYAFGTRAWLRDLGSWDWRGARKDARALGDVAMAVAQLADVSRTHRRRAGWMAATELARRLAELGTDGSYEEAIATLLEVSQGPGRVSFHPESTTSTRPRTVRADERPLREQLHDLAMWWSEALSTRLPPDVSEAITSVLGPAGTAEAYELAVSVDERRLAAALQAQRDARARGLVSTANGLTASHAAFAHQVYPNEGEQPWVDLVRIATGLDGMRPHIAPRVYRAEDGTLNEKQLDVGLHNPDGSLRWDQAMARIEGEYGRSRLADKREVLSHALGPRVMDFVNFLNELLAAEADWSQLPRAGAEPRLSENGRQVLIQEFGPGLNLSEALAVGPDPNFAAALADAVRVMTAAINTWSLTQTSESHWHDAALRSGTDVGLTRSDPEMGAVDIMRGILIEAGFTAAQIHILTSGSEPAAKFWEREALRGRLDDSRLKRLWVHSALFTDFGRIGDMSQDTPHSVTWNDDGDPLLPPRLVSVYSRWATSHDTATGQTVLRDAETPERPDVGKGCPAGFPFFGACGGQIVSGNAMPPLLEVFNRLVSDALFRGVTPRPAR